MRHEKQQVSNDHPEAVRSAPVPPTGDRAARSDVPEDALDDRGTFDDPTTDDDRTDDQRAEDTDRRSRPDDEGGFHEPGPLPTTFGATTVADAVAASALASPRPQDQPDPRAERTAQPGDGAEDGEREVCAPTPPPNCTAATASRRPTAT